MKVLILKVEMSDEDWKSFCIAGDEPDELNGSNSGWEYGQEGSIESVANLAEDGIQHAGESYGFPCEDMRSLKVEVLYHNIELSV